jgi:hypothetical protein
MKHEPTTDTDSPLRSIPAAQIYLGGISRAGLYSILPRLDTVKIGGRRMILRASLDAFIDASRVKA